MEFGKRCMEVCDTVPKNTALGKDALRLIEDKYMAECEHEHWLKICADCGQVIEDEDIVYVATGFDSTTVYEEIIVE